MSYPYDDPEQQPTGYNSYSQPSQPIHSAPVYSQSISPPPIGFQPRRYNSPGLNNNDYNSSQLPPPVVGYETHAPAYNPQSHFQENYDQPIYHQSTSPPPVPQQQQFQQIPHSSHQFNSNNQYDSQHSLSTLNIPGSMPPFQQQHSPSGYSLQDNRDPFQGEVGDEGEEGMDLPLLTAGGGYRRRMASGASGFDLGGGNQIGGGNNVQFGGNGNGNHQNFDPRGYNGGHGAEQSEQEQENTVRYGKIPQRQMRRYKTVKRVQLYHGNLILDCQVPPKLLERCPRKEDREFTHMRYTAATCDPSDFMEERYSLRQNLYETPRRTELFIVLTMYNEDEVLFSRTMHGVIKNIQHLCSRSRSKTWGADGWKKVVVCIVSDGRAKVNSRTLSVLATMGVYQDGVAKNIVAGKPVTAHIYEYTVQNWLDPELKSRSSEVPVQIIFCLKEKNAKKINSHRWFFSAFGPILQPNVCVLLDVGTQPGPTSIYKLWKTFDLNSNVGGACGEIVALKGKYFSNLLNPLVAAQNFEYKMSNILDKPLESVFGYITVLPGAFSAYRYIALQNDSKGEGPLREYFKGETLHTDPKADLWARNAYLAEDRILCWELVSKRGSAWLLHYQRSAYAVTDVPDRAADLISQRRRWLNGSFFAGIHSSYHFGYIYRSDHTFWRKMWLHVELLYQTFNMIFAWFALGNYYITFIILTQSLADKSFGLKDITVFNTVLKYYYIALVVTCFLLALGNRPAGSVVMYNLIIISFALITSYMLFAAGFITFKGIVNVKNAIELDGGKFTTADIFSNSIFRNIVLSLLSTYGLYLLGSLIFFDPAHMLTSFFQYLLIAPSYINVINVYAFCNVQDVTWGNRPEEKQSTDLGAVKATDGGNVVDVAIPTDEKDINAAYDDAEHLLGSKGAKVVENLDAETRMTDSYRAIRTNVVLAWTLSNGALVAAILSTSAGSNITTDGGSAKVNEYMTFLLFSVAGLAAFRFVGCFMYTILWLFQN